MHPVKLGLGLVLVAWGFADYLFPLTVLRVQSDLLNVPPEPSEEFADHKRRVGLVCLLAGVITLAATVG
ncbi:hypothetical protein M0R88_12750 [Halorussus gelatinilyticus]|uniref:Uncharacterized protein n=1 Tax=Halorussus gelatinilyticus TaxID=2937524 RepID=A0A8U0IGM6_9EURY|nr:hypothetical protein [Halorussus gelatinilyticus]UPV99391.1 hypothetical protein M0R88_12750 [Halorussus gelatinilyticus]